VIADELDLTDLPSSREVQQRILDECEARSFDASSCFAIRLALEEAISNAFKHGNRHDPAKRVRLRYRIAPDEVEFEIEDEGEGFDPDAVPDPTLDENLELPSGRGIVLIRSFMSEVAYLGAGNRLRMRYERPADGEGEAGEAGDGGDAGGADGEG